MSPAARQKACIACANSKRRCDKRLPECQRCLDRDVDCAYPQKKRRARKLDTGEEAFAPSYAVHDYDEIQDFEGADVGELGNILDFTAWDELVAADPTVSSSEEWATNAPGSSTDTGILAVNSSSPEDNRNPVNSILPWFLQEETWKMQQARHESGGPAVIDLQLFIRTVDEMLKSWVRDGYNGFIHRKLYQYGMPTCVQDAFTTLAAYTNCTQAVKDTILQITQERLSIIVCQYTPNTSDRQGILNHLARVQALFVYEFIGLFDGSPRLRVSAEQHLPTLRSWVAQMWEAVKQYKGEGPNLSLQTPRWAETNFESEYQTTSELWKTWVLTESVRRIQIIINSVANSYQCMTGGWAECTGAVMFTARCGLWEAESAIQWSDLACRKSPLLVPPLRAGSLISQYPAEEFDEFVKTFWALILGSEKVQSWLDRSDRMSRMSV